MSTIVCQTISKFFGNTRVLDNLDISVSDGHVAVVLGESGSGKTTLLRTIAGFERAERGVIMIDGEVVDAPQRFVPPEKRRIGYVSQEGNLFPHLTVAGNVAFGLPRRERGSGRVGELLDLVGLSDLGNRYPHQLSGGQQQRVALARALAPRPRVVLLDEPFSSLDAGLRSALRMDVMAILREREATTLLVTHDQSEALSVANMVGIIMDGRIRQLARPEDLYSHPVDVMTAKFLGEANIVAGTAYSGQVATAFGDLRLERESRSVTGPATVLIRPEQIALAHLGGEASPPDRTTGRVVHREYYGHDWVVQVEVGVELPVRVRCAGPCHVEIGDTVALSATGEVAAWQADTVPS